METYEQKRRRLFGKLKISEYLEELNKIMNREIKESNLLSIVETDCFLENYSRPSQAFFHTIIPFEEKELNIRLTIMKEKF